MATDADDPRDPQEPRHLDWTVVREHPAADYRVFRVTRHDARHPTTGEVATFSVVRSTDWVNVVALTAQRDVVLVRQYRHGTRRQTLEIPGGMIDPGESAADAARRELREETGYQAPEWREIGVVEPNPAIQDNRCYTYLALGAHRVGDARPDPGEVLVVETRPLDELDDLVTRGDIRHSLVVAAFYHLRCYLRARSDLSP